MIVSAIIVAVVVLAVAVVASDWRRFEDVECLTEREAAERLRPYSGAVECAPQDAPIERIN
jgi:hypothetical protein